MPNLIRLLDRVAARDRQAAAVLTFLLNDERRTLTPMMAAVNICRNTGEITQNYPSYFPLVSGNSFDGADHFWDATLVTIPSILSNHSQVKQAGRNFIRRPDGNCNPDVIKFGHRFDVEPVTVRRAVPV